mmetsp:Transcript_9155/g.22068  ORF Transcript_9155/g.22068 Transcript_9155/m.22068 type:complete len:496 (-) Transcript_9155:335-1822(-)
MGVSLHVAPPLLSGEQTPGTAVFHVLDNGGKIKAQDKINKLTKMLAVSYEPDGDDPEADPLEECTVFELVGQDRPGLLADVTQLLTCNGCDVRSAAVWTFRSRVAFVMSVMEGGRPMKNSTKLARLHELLYKMMGDRAQRATVAVKHVVGDVHHDRRLHQRLLEEDLAEWQLETGLCPAGPGVQAARFGHHSTGALLKPRSPLGADGCPSGDNVDESVRSLRAASGTSCDSSATHAGIEPPSLGSPMEVSTASRPLPAEQQQARSMPESMCRDCNLRSVKYSKPEIRVGFCKQKRYWVATIKCKDRNKLLFDTVCTLADMQYDVFHAAIDSHKGQARQEYYMRPSRGDSSWDAARAQQLRAMLELAVQRRFPQGLKLHIHSVDKFGLLASLSRVLFENQLSVRRAVVKTHRVNNSTGHSFYVMDVTGAPPDQQKVERACRMIGGKLIEVGDAKEQIRVGSGDHKFSFSFLNRQWQKEWAGSPGSAGSCISSSSSS